MSKMSSKGVNNSLLKMEDGDGSNSIEQSINSISIKSGKTLLLTFYSIVKSFHQIIMLYKRNYTRL